MSRDQDADAAPDDHLTGLQWLSQERPEAMQHLLAFFRESGQHLDPKTRFLISVVTKVVRLSPRGLRQYIPRAMRAGASRDEVLDAILCAYPAAGLTNVVDAVQVLRDLAREGLLPGVEGDDAGDSAADETVAAEPTWTDVDIDVPEPGTAAVIAAGGRRLALYNVDGELHVTDNACLHQGGELGCSDLNGKVVTCHRHGWSFDVTTGQCLTRPGEQVSSFPVRVQDGTVQVLV